MVNEVTSSKVAGLESKTNLSRTQVGHTDEKAPAGGKRHPAERVQVPFVDKERTFVGNHLKSQIETHYSLPSCAQGAKKAKEGKEVGQNVR